MFNLNPDGLNIGPAVMNWSNLGLLLGVFTWLGLARIAQAQAVALVTLVVARIWAALPGLDLQRPLLQNLLDVVDLRRGAWAWLPGLAAGLLFLLWKRRYRLRSDLPTVLGAVLAGSLPLLLKPAPPVSDFPDTQFVRLDGQKVNLPRPAVVNLWATWCGPCRSEMPLLLDEARRDPTLILLNVGENAQVVQSFITKDLLKEDVPGVWLGGEAVTGPLRVSGFPTTLALNASGQIVARHLGPLSRAQLLALQKAATQP